VRDPTAAMQIYNSNGEANQRFRLRLISDSAAVNNRDRDRDSGRSAADLARAVDD